MSGVAEIAEHWSIPPPPTDDSFTLLVCGLLLLILSIAAFALSTLFRRSGLRWGILATLSEDGDDNYRSVRVVHPARIDMTRLHNPFLVKLADDKASSLKDGANIEIYYDVERAFYRCYWGVDAEHLFRCLLHSTEPESGVGREPLSEEWPFLLRRTAAEGPSDAAVVVSCSHRLPAGHRKLALHVACPDFEAVQLALGSAGDASPCAKYPLVIVCWTSETDSLYNIVAYVTVIHLTSDACRVPSCSLYDFAKTQRGPSMCLQRLYAGVGTSRAGCVVCLVRAAECVLLPCRHLCICRVCARAERDRNDSDRGAATREGSDFLSIDACPLCRALVASYFCV